MKYKYPEIMESPEYKKLREELKEFIKDDIGFKAMNKSFIEPLLHHELINEEIYGYMLKPQAYKISKIYSPSFFERLSRKQDRYVIIKINEETDKMKLNILNQAICNTVFNISLKNYSREFRILFFSNLMEHFKEFLWKPEIMPKYIIKKEEFKGKRGKIICEILRTMVEEALKGDFIPYTPDFSALNPILLIFSSFPEIYRKLVWDELQDKLVEIYLDTVEEHFKKENKEFDSLEELKYEISRIEKYYSEDFKRKARKILIEEKNSYRFIIEKIREILLKTEKDIEGKSKDIVSEEEKVKKHLDKYFKYRESIMDYLRNEIKRFVERILEDNIKEESKFRDVYLKLKEELNKEEGDEIYVKIINKFIEDLNNIGIRSIGVYNFSPLSFVNEGGEDKYKKEEELLTELYKKVSDLSIRVFYRTSGEILRAISKIFKGVEIDFDEEEENYSLSNIERIYEKTYNLLIKVYLFWKKFFRVSVNAGELIPVSGAMSGLAKSALSQFKLTPDKGYLYRDKPIEKHEIYEYANKFSYLLDCIINRLKKAGIRIPLEPDKI